MPLLRAATNWIEDNKRYASDIGDRWLSEKRTLLLQVPSVLVPETWDALVKTRKSNRSILRKD